MIFASAASLAVACAALPSRPQAADPKLKDAPKSADDARKALESRRDALESQKKREKEIQKDLSTLSEDQASINAQLLETAALVQQAEGRLTEKEERLAGLDGQEKDLRGSLTVRYGQISKLLSVLQRMGRNPPPVMITKREDALKMVRSAMMVSAAFPEMRAQAVALSAKLNELMRVMESARTEREAAKQATDELNDKRLKLAELMETKRRTQSERQTELAAVRTAASEMTKNVKELNELISKLDQAVTKNTGLGAYNEESKTQPPGAPGEAEVAMVPPAASNALEIAPAAGNSAMPGSAGRLKPSIPFQAARAKLPMPAAGRRVLSFGEKTQYGAQSKGIVIETRANAQVTSPCDGWIVFAGEFRSYGRVLIINPGGGYHVLMAGLSQIDVAMGQFVVAAEPVGTMGGSPQQGQSSSPLYIEFRKDSEPVDPDPWWVPSQRVESGKKVQG
jgi:septal ring factor EnvC (AmiA/AmiB activator)